jgi:hypothetical protein
LGDGAVARIGVVVGVDVLGIIDRYDTREKWGWWLFGEREWGFFACMYIIMYVYI